VTWKPIDPAAGWLGKVDATNSIFSSKGAAVFAPPPPTCQHTPSMVAAVPHLIHDCPANPEKYVPD